MTIHAIPSSKSRDGEKLVGVLNHPNWLIFANMSSSIHNYLRVITYINIRFSSFWFSLCKDILNYRDISDSLQLALKYLNNTEVDISNVLIMAGDFNI